MSCAFLFVLGHFCHCAFGAFLRLSWVVFATVMLGIFATVIGQIRHC
jgi:hypothetical protein